MAAVSILREREQFLISSVGFPFRRTLRTHSICAHALGQPSEALIIPDARYDPRKLDCLAVAGRPFIRAYSGRPLCPTSRMAMGTLCACALSPRSFSHDQLAALDQLADAAAAILRSVARGGRQTS